MDNNEERKRAILNEWEEEVFDSNQTQFTLSSIELIDEADDFLRDRIKPMYESKHLEVQMAATYLTACYQAAKRVNFVSQDKLFNLFSRDPNRKSKRSSPLNGEEFKRVFKFLERTCFQTIEPSSIKPRLPAIVRVKHLGVLDAMNEKYGIVSRCDIGFLIDAALEWRREVCAKKGFENPSCGYFDPDVEINVSDGDLRVESEVGELKPDLLKNPDQNVVQLPYDSSAMLPDEKESTRWQKK